MKKEICLILALAVATHASAQDTFLNNYMTNTSDLYGTARYVGMGGAMGALGADISAIGSNPAAIGLFRRSSASLTAGVMWQTNRYTEGEAYTHPSFDQLGFVISFRMGDSGMKYMNFGFNYQKKNNLSHTFIADYTGSSVLNYVGGVYDVMNNFDYINPVVETAIASGLYRENEKNPYAVNDGSDFYDGNGFMRIMHGHTQGYDLNLSGNYNDRVFFGLSVGLDYLRYKSDAMYDEYWRGVSGNDLSFSYNNYQEVKGWGYNIKFGTIVRPIEDLPLRIGLAIETPTWYQLDYYGECSFLTAYELLSNNQYATTNNTYKYNSGSNNLTYNFSTPWRFRLSAGHTFSSSLAVGLEYEYADYSFNRVSYPDGAENDYGPWSNESKDRELNRHTSNSLKGVHAFKAGVEYKPSSYVALRAGYNYYGASCKKEAYLDHTIDSYAMTYVSNTDYMLLGDVNIFTLGVGYSGKHLYVDAAYKYRAQKADFYPFYDYYYEQIPRELDLDRHQLMVTLGYKF